MIIFMRVEVWSVLVIFYKYEKCPKPVTLRTIGSLSSDVFERRTSTGSEPFSLLISLDATVFVLPIGLILVETICPKMCSKSRLKCAKSPFPVDVRRSKTSLLKLPINTVRTFYRPWIFG